MIISTHCTDFSFNLIIIMLADPLLTLSAQFILHANLVASMTLSHCPHLNEVSLDFQTFLKIFLVPSQ